MSSVGVSFHLIHLWWYCNIFLGKCQEAGLGWACLASFGRSHYSEVYALFNMYNFDHITMFIIMNIVVIIVERYVDNGGANVHFYL